MIHLNTILEHFWKRWKKEYLLELREAHRHGKHCDKISLGDMVLIPGDGKPRGFWKPAKVESLITGNDGQTRGAVVRVASADRRPTLLRRPLQLLYPLEIHDKETTLLTMILIDKVPMKPTMILLDKVSMNDSDRQSPDADNVSDRSTVKQVPRSRSRRIAAKNAREIIRILTEDS